MSAAMSTFKSDLMRVLTERGFVHQVSDAAALDELAATTRITAYAGYDCTASSLHVGHLLWMMMLRWMQRTGHRPIALTGGGTTRVGDPSGRDQTRQLLSYDQIAANKVKLKQTVARFISFDSSPTGALDLDNDQWLGPLNYIDFLRDVGRHFSVNRMLAFDSVKVRLEREQELSFLEFNYMILQAYDFVELNRRHGCILQIGGSDQWGNIVSGIDLGHRMGTPQLYGLTCPLLTTASGAKMGKTAKGAVWLSADQLSPYEYWQFWRNTEDADVGRFLKLFTELPLDEIARLAALAGAERNEAKKVLATAATALLHGHVAAEEAAAAARATFEGAGVADALPTVTVAADELTSGIGVLALFVRAGLVASNGEARRQIRGGGLRLNDEVVADEAAIVSFADLNAGAIKLSLGRKKHVLVKPEG
jgi:tyrosyl-tRNA synthetase